MVIGIFQEQRPAAEVVDRHGGDERLIHHVELALERNIDSHLRRGLLVLVSDFFDPRGVAALAEALRPIRHRVLLLQLVRPSDAEPTVQGDVRLTDCETGEAADLTITPKILARYRAAYAQFNADLADVARRRQAPLVKIDVEGDIVEQLSLLFKDGGFRV